MKSNRFFGFVTAGLLIGATVCSAAKFEQLNVGELSLDGTKITATAAQLNAIAGGDVSVDDATVGGKLKVTGTISNTTLTASRPVFTDANKELVSGTTGSALTGVTGTGVCNSASMTSGTVAITASTGAVTATGVCNSASMTTGTVVVVLSTVVVTNYAMASAISSTYTNANFDVTNVFVNTVYTWDITTNTLVTGVTATITPTLVTPTVSVTVTGGDAVMTNAAAVLTPVTAIPTVSVTLTPATATFAKP